MVFIIILAAIVVVAVCLESSFPGHVNDDDIISAVDFNQYDICPWKDAAPGEIISGSENLSRGEDLLPGGSTYEFNRLLNLNDD